MEKFLNGMTDLELAKTTSSPELLDILYDRGTPEVQEAVLSNPSTRITTRLRAQNQPKKSSEDIAREILEKNRPDYLRRLDSSN